MLPKISDYWDTRTSAIQSQSLNLAPINSVDRESQLLDLQTSIARHTDALQDDDLAMASFVISEDLYKAVANLTEFPDEDVYDYLRATAQTFFHLLKERGLVLRYLVDNDYEGMLGGPVFLFPEWYSACDLVYICPQMLAGEQLKTEQDIASADILVELPNYLNEGWEIAERLVRKCEAEDRSYVFLIASAAELDLSQFLEERLNAPTSGGIQAITVYRDQEAELGSTAKVNFPD